MENLIKLKGLIGVTKLVDLGMGSLLDMDYKAYFSLV